MGGSHRDDNNLMRPFFRLGEMGAALELALQVLSTSSSCPLAGFLEIDASKVYAQLKKNEPPRSAQVAVKETVTAHRDLAASLRMQERILLHCY